MTHQIPWQAPSRGWIAAGLLLGFGGTAVAGCGSDEFVSPTPAAGGTAAGGSAGHGDGGSATTSSSGGQGGAGAPEGGASGAGARDSDNGAGGTAAGGTGGQSETPEGIVDMAVSFDSISLPGASRTVDFHFVPGAPDQLFVLGHRGTLYHFQITGSSAVLLAEAAIPNTLQAKGCGALSMALDPEFSSNHFVYVSRCVDLVNNTIARYRLDPLENLGDTEAEILTITLDWDRDEWHRFGSMGFESDGQTLWVLLGDMFFPEHAQDVTRKNGSLLRILPNREPDGSGYERAFGNAFEPGGENDPDIYVYGIRSPWRGTRDRFGRFWIGDVGDVTAEEVNLATEPGQNFGWDASEGPCTGEACGAVRDPIIHYGRSDGKAVWVGEMYELPSVDRYYGWFTDNVFYGDFYGEWIRAAAVNEHGSVRKNREVGRLGEVTQWRVGPDGYLYALTLPSYLYRVMPEPVFAAD